MDEFRPAVIALQQLLGERCVADPEVLRQHAHDVSHHPAQLPDAVVFPESPDEVAQVLQICQRTQTPVIPFGAGTAVEGGVVPIFGGVCVSLTRMNRVRRFSPVDQDITVEAGLTRLQLAAFLDADPSRLYFPVDPGADAAIGGMVATCAAGSGATLYGTMRTRVLGLEVVLADGTRIECGTRARKSSAGYDLTRLFVGSEGTLGIVTAVTLRLERRPDAISAAVCPFPTVRMAVEAVIAVRAAGVPMARIELLDEVQMRASIRYSGLPYAEAPTLFFEFHGTPAGVAEQAQRVGDIVQSCGALDFQWATDEAERQRLWRGRYDCYYAALALREGCAGYTTDVCVPLSELAGCIERTRALLASLDVPSPLLGHVGDGNYHVLFLVDPQNPAELATAKRLSAAIVADALRVGGTCSGEHGIGLGKIDALEQQYGPAVDVMRRIKAALDPAGIMNPGKVLRHTP